MSLGYEFIGLIFTPIILLHRILPKVDDILAAVNTHYYYSDMKHFVVGGYDIEEGEKEVETDFKETEILRSEQLIPYLQKLENFDELK